MSRKTAHYYKHARPEMQARVPATARRVLDLGCSEGAFGEALKARGVEVWGIEIDPDAAAVAAKRLDHVLVGDAAAALAQVPDGAFDAVTCNDVLEHLVDPYATLRTIRTKLAPGGVVVASIPNVRHLPEMLRFVAGGDWRYEDEGVMDKTHLRFFTRKSIHRMFDEAGYEVVSIEGINPVRGVKFWISWGPLRDTRWPQFAVVAKARA